MEPRIQYAKTKDGVSIAYYTLGEGMPFLHVGWPFSHAQLLWESPVTRPWLEALAQRYQLVFYDSRGSGLSQRGLASLTLDMLVLDMEAVVERLSLDRFVLFAPFHQGQAAVQYTVENTGRVAALILWGSHVSGDAVEIGAVEWNVDFQGTPASELYYTPCALLRSGHREVPVAGPSAAGKPVRVRG